MQIPISQRLVLGIGCALAIAGCGSQEAADLDGTLTATIHDPGNADTIVQAWDASNLVLDAPPGSGDDFFGTCDYGNTTWSLDLNQAKSTSGVSEVVMLAENTLSDAEVAIIAIGVTYTGTCTITPNDWDRSHDFAVEMNCTALTTASGPRTLDVGASLNVTNCTRSPGP